MASEQPVLGTGRTGGREATTGVIPGRFALAVGMPHLPSPSGWNWTPLSEVAQLESGHTPSRKHSDYWNGNVPWIGIKDAVENHGRTIFNTYQHVTELGLANSSARLLPANTVCLSRTASVGHVVVMGKPMATSQDFVNWVCGPELEPQFLKYILLAENEALWRFASGTTHQTIYYPEAKAFHVCLPPIETQLTIAHILGTLDDKIELNRRMNETLEAMAKAIFKSWFVDFDPVRAKMEGRKPEGMDAATARICSDGFEDSELGPVPRGWRAGRLDELAFLQRGFDITKKEQRIGTVPVVSSSGCGSYHDTAMVKGPGVVLGRKGVLGSIFYIEEDFWPHDTTLWVRDFHGHDPHFIYYFLRAKAREFSLLDVGSANPTLNRNHVHCLQVPVPPRDLTCRFGAIVAPLFDMREANLRQNKILGNVRDTLLPRLLSGEISTAHAEKLLKRAT